MRPSRGNRHRQIFRTAPFTLLAGVGEAGCDLFLAVSRPRAAGGAANVGSSSSSLSLNISMSEFMQPDWVKSSPKLNPQSLVVEADTSVCSGTYFNEC